MLLVLWQSIVSALSCGMACYVIDTLITFMVKALRRPKHMALPRAGGDEWGAWDGFDGVQTVGHLRLAVDH